MKYWLEAKMEKTDGKIKCSVCGISSMSPNKIFAEHELFSGNVADPQYPNIRPTGRFMCHDCGKVGLL